MAVFFLVIFILIIIIGILIGIYFLYNWIKSLFQPTPSTTPQSLTTTTTSKTTSTTSTTTTASISKTPFLTNRTSSSSTQTQITSTSSPPYSKDSTIIILSSRLSASIVLVVLLCVVLFYFYKKRNKPLAYIQGNIQSNIQNNYSFDPINLPKTLDYSKVSLKNEDERRCAKNQNKFQPERLNRVPFKEHTPQTKTSSSILVISSLQNQSSSNTIDNNNLIDNRLNESHCSENLEIDKNAEKNNNYILPNNAKKIETKIFTNQLIHQASSKNPSHKRNKFQNNCNHQNKRSDSLTPYKSTESVDKRTIKNKNHENPVVMITDWILYRNSFDIFHYTNNLNAESILEQKLIKISESRIGQGWGVFMTVYGPENDDDFLIENNYRGNNRYASKVKCAFAFQQSQLRNLKKMKDAQRDIWRVSEDMDLNNYNFKVVYR